MGNLMKATDLHTVLTVASTFAGNDDTLPMLTGVRLEFTESQVTGAGTDRFVLGVQRADYAGEAFETLIYGADVKTVVRIAKTAARDANHRTVEISVKRQGGWDSADDARSGAPATKRPDGRIESVTFTFSTGEAITVQTADCEFPKYRQLIPGGGGDESFMADTATVKGFNASYLAKFAKVPGHHSMAVVVGKATRPTVISIGDDFVGLIMPVRLPAGEDFKYQRPAWLD